MGLIFSKTYLDFPEDQWKQVSNDPVVFESVDDDAVLELMDEGGKNHKLHVRKGGRIKFMRVVGKYRLTWNDDDVTKS